MVDKVTLQNVSSFQNDTSAVSTVNNNMALITTAMDNTLSRDGTSPNMMGAALDMNSNQIFNLPAPSSVNSPARLIDVAGNPTIVVPGTGTLGHVVPFLDGNNTFSGTSTFTNTVTIPAQTVSASQIVNGTITSTQVGTNALSLANLPQLGSAGILGRSSGSGNIGALTASGARQVLAVNSAGSLLAFAQPQGDQLLGSITNDSATAGNVGEYVSSTIAGASAVSLVSTTAKTITSISLTAGDWDIWVNAYLAGGSSTTVTSWTPSISTTTNVINTAEGFYGITTYGSATPFTTSLGAVSLAVGPIRVSLSGTTTYFYTAAATFATSTCSGYGIIQARRVR